MSNITAILANVPVPSIDAALPLYIALSGTDDVHRFPYGELHVARVGSFLLIEGPLTGYSAEQRVTIVVKSVDEARAAVRAAGSDVLDGPHAVANGMRLVVRTPDGSVLEFLEPRAA